ncbi:uncharacterized protein A4U43_C01F20550 [Asparagus officinalis]|uniref:F-box protein n=1 Tax=Asparagus officinalis TaxID=4686 RepID=A0A5P1FVC5_ASPOF|nr:uncharacterized protein A4U43_C01F20550 [Asparagus officinalis]
MTGTSSSSPPINSITLSASLMSAISSISTQSASTALNISSAILFSAATGMMVLVNKMQPSQLAEEQRKATQLYKQLEKSIHTTIAIGSSPTETDVDEAVEKLLAIDRAYPLPLLPLQDKFPKKVQPARWWPKHKPRKRVMTKKKNNGWSQEIEEEMRGVVRLLKAKDQNEYRHVGEIAVKINRMLAISGPVLTGLASVGASASSFSSVGGWPAMLAVVGGVMAMVVNTLEHGGQLGMVFELFRNCYGYYKEMEEEIEKNLGEREVDKREDGELFRMKIALKLGRSLSELKSLSSYASPSSRTDEDIQEFAGKLF